MRAILDTGPLVAMLSRHDEHHGWAVHQADRFDRAFIACEAVLTEAHFLLSRAANGSRRLNSLISAGVIDIRFQYADHIERVNELIHTYENVPMSFADACLVRLSELHRGTRIFTTDTDFRIYRKHGNKSIQLFMP